MPTADGVKAVIGKRRREGLESSPASLSDPDPLVSHDRDRAEKEHTEPVAKRTRRSSLVSNQPTEITTPTIEPVSDRSKRAERRASQVVGSRQ
jgi:hypothetical protein